jgi:hypothetical protein
MEYFKTLSGTIMAWPDPVAARSRAQVCGRSLAGTVAFKYRRWQGCLSLVCLVCHQVEVSVKADHSSRESYQVCLSVIVQPQ